MTVSERVWSDLRDRYGDALRTVIRYHPTEFEARLRPDLRSQYSDADVQTFVDEAIVSYLNMEERSDTADLGQFRGTVRIFEDVWVYSWPDDLDAKAGFLITLERDGGVEIDALGEIDDYLTEEIGPDL